MSAILVHSLCLASPVTIVEPDAGAPHIQLAAKEVRRYLYLRAGEVPALRSRVPPTGAAVVIGLRGDPLVASLLDAAAGAESRTLGPEQYLLRTVVTPERHLVCIVGGDDLGVLYGAYRFCELLGVRFYLHGDVLPDDGFISQLPIANEIGRPLFATRGLLPFHDFPEGPDWWTRDDYLAHLSQMVKLRMNLLALHCYPEDQPRPDPEPHPEPLVWIGRYKDMDERGQVKASYPAFWAATGRQRFWGYDPMRTSDFTGGADQLFAREDHAAEIFDGLPAQPETPEQCNEVFNRAGAFLHDTFAFARQIGVKICLGTETPLTIPQPVQVRLKAEGKNPADPQVVQELYAGIFSRIQKLYPVDYYCLWTPESWTWAGNNPAQYAATVTDIRAALAAQKSLGQPFTLATCGWVLGPAQDRTALDHFLPADIPMGCINREVGHDLVEPGFAAVQGRPKWAIPWMENDQDLTSPQLWAGRMRYDAADALSLGCTGLLGIHWRTQVLAPTVTALAAAAWDQSYRPTDWNLRSRLTTTELHGGRTVHAAEPVTGATQDSAVYQTLLEDCRDCYRMGIPDGRYTITLLFNEPVHAVAGRRVFDIELQGQILERNLDIFARAGRNRALDLVYRDIKIGDSPLHLRFVPHVGSPIIAGIGVEGTTLTGTPLARWVNLGGGPVGKFDGDFTRGKPVAAVRKRSLPVEDFYIDFARANFGAAVAEPAGRLLTQIDGSNLPQSSHWERGPGEINPLAPAPGSFAFVADFAGLRPAVQGAGNLARFDYWLNTFRYQEALAHVGSLRSDLDDRMHAVQTESDLERKKNLGEAALTVRIQLARAWEQMMSRLVACADTSGELGTIANLEQHNRTRLHFLDLHDERLVAALGRPLPPEIQPGRAYDGPPRLIVPTVRSEAKNGEALKLTVIAVDRVPMTHVALHWRRWTQPRFQTIEASHLGRAVYQVALPSNDDIEYFVTARTSEGDGLTWPATAPRICQTVIRIP